MQTVWEESGYLLLSHQDTHLQKLTGQTSISEMTLTVMVLRGAYFKPRPLWNRLVLGHLGRGSFDPSMANLQTSWFSGCP